MSAQPCRLRSGLVCILFVFCCYEIVKIFPEERDFHFLRNPGDFPRAIDLSWVVPDKFFSSGLKVDSASQPPQINPCVPGPGPGGERALSPDLRGSENLQILRLTRVEEVWVFPPRPWRAARGGFPGKCKADFVH